MGDNQEIDAAKDGENVEELDTENAEVELDEEGNPIEAAPELDEEGNPVKVEIPDWQKTEDDEAEELPDVPVKKHIKMKTKLKGRLKERDTEIEQLRKENAELKTSGPTAAVIDLPPRPKADDFETDELYEVAFEEWDDKRIEAKLAAQNSQTNNAAAVRRFNEKTEKAVEAHYGRQEELVESSGMKAEYFKEADTAVRETVEAILPKQGNAVTDHIISLLGKGSEKVMFFIGRNKAARLEFQSLLAEDKQGYKALVYLGEQKERLNNPKKVTSKAPKPAADADGDISTTPKGAAFKKKYDKAHAAGKSQIAYKLKQEAKAAKIDVSSW